MGKKAVAEEEEEELADATTPKSAKQKKRQSKTALDESAEDEAAEVVADAGEEKRRKKNKEGDEGGRKAGSEQKRIRETEPSADERPKKKKHAANEETAKSDAGKAAKQAATKPADKVDVSESNLRVFVSNIPRHLDEATIQRDFEECGEIVNIKLLVNKDTDEFRGIAFLTFKDEAGFEAALKYDGDDYGGQRLRVKKAETKSSGKGGGAAEAGLDPKPEGCNSVVVKRLAPDVVEEDLKKLFRHCGSGPVHVGLLRDRKTGKSRCTARVDFEDGDAVDEAMKLLGSKLKGTVFTLNYCQPKTW